MKPWMLLTACFLSGAGTGLCLLFPLAGPAVFILPVPALIILMSETNSRRVFKLCAAFCLGLCMTTYSPAFSIEPAVSSTLVFWIDLAIYVAICTIHGSIFTAGLWIGLRLPAINALRWLCTAVFWTIAEWLCGAGPFAWPTLQLSLALWKYPVLIQGARWGGHLLVSALIMAVSVLLCEVILHRHNRRWLLPLAGVILLSVGNISLYFFAPVPPKADVSIAVVQPGKRAIGENRADVYKKSLALAEKATKTNPSIILLPEGVLPFSLLENEDLQPQWGAVAQEADADLLVGGIEENRSSIHQFGPDGRLLTTYLKRRQVPFFENGTEGSFSWKVDNRAGVISSGSGKIGTVICYESMFAPMTRYAADEGAEILMVSTNDSWFDSDTAKRLHLAHGVYRAVETGRSLIQAGLNGYTAVVDAQGRLTYSLPAGEPGILEADVSFSAQNTPYLKWGYSWIFLCLTSVLGCALKCRFARYFKKNPRKKED